MKRFFAAVLLLPFFAQAQDCKIKKEADPYTKETKLTTGFIPFNAGINRVLLSVDANKTEIDFFFAMGTGEGKCFDPNSTATVNFEGERLKANFKNTGSMNCEGLFHFTFKNSTTTPSQLQRLATKKVASIQFTGPNNTLTQLTLKPEEQQMLMNTAACMIAEAKTLLVKN